jgi:hypothetical protein
MGAIENYEAFYAALSLTIRPIMIAALVGGYWLALGRANLASPARRINWADRADAVLRGSAFTRAARVVAVATEETRAGAEFAGSWDDLASRPVTLTESFAALDVHSCDKRERAFMAAPIFPFLGEKLERAKGFEPSTPTLARSCSTPELHPHPWDCRLNVTGDRRPMPNADCECNSARTA